MKRLRRCKIVATLGPASDTREVLAKLFVAGVDVFRINMSHASHDGMRERIRMIRSLEEEYNRPIGILVDLQGPKLRVGTFAEGGLTLEIRDDGTGLPPSARTSHGLGLRIMAHRAAIIGAKFSIEAPDGGGTLVICQLPHEPTIG